MMMAEVINLTKATAPAAAKEPGDDAPLPLRLEVAEFRPQRGDLVLVSGNLGVGKSSFLHALLGEMPCINGRAQPPTWPVAFQPQMPVLLDGTIRENILFGVPDHECDEAGLQRALEVSQLSAEMDSPLSTLHRLRERTHVGKRGGHISGGQRARTALARSVYAVLSGASAAVLDDPVASIDNEVCLSAWTAAVVGAMGGATRVVAVNSQLLERLAPTADRLVLLTAGGEKSCCRITYDGPPDGALQDPENIFECLGGDFKFSKSCPIGNGAEACSPVPPSPVEWSKAAPMPQELDGGGESPALGLADFIRDCPALRDFTEAKPGTPLRLTAKQWKALQVRLLRLQNQTSVPELVAPVTATTYMGIFLSFIRRTHGWGLLGIVVGALSSAESFVTYGTVRQWELGGHGMSDVKMLVIFSCELIFFTALFVSSGLFETFGKAASSRSLRCDLDRTLSSLGMRYFWQAPKVAEMQIRRAVNLDMDSLSALAKLPMFFMQLTIFALLIVSYYPGLVTLLGIALGMRFRMNKAISWVSTKMDPLMREAEAKLDANIGEQLDSLISIRALKREQCFERALQPGVMNRNYRDYLNHTLSFGTDLSSASIDIIFQVASIMTVIDMKARGIDISIVLTISTLIGQLSGIVQGACSLLIPFMDLMQNYRELASLINTDCVETSAGSEPPAGWPEECRISFQGVTFRYCPHSPAALCDLDLEIRPREKLGVVGRTGSGKSTLVSVLMRLSPLQGVPPGSGGRVLLDGVDLETVKLRDLRRLITLVPQEPALFKMSLKKNLGGDWLTDAEVLTVLEWCGLDARQLTGKATLQEALAAEVGSSSMSSGQQQLLMAARALARRPRVMILDESTASLDRTAADHLLEVINRHCQEATVLSIAHRLRFVLKSDRVLVLGPGGRILDLDTPTKLLENKSGYFATSWQLEQIEESQHVT